MHAIDNKNFEKKWTVSTGGPLVSSGNSDEDSESSYNVISSVDGSLIVQNSGGMRKTSVKARMLAEKAPFLSQSGLLFTGEKASRILGVDIDSGRMVGHGSQGKVDIRRLESDSSRSRILSHHHKFNGNKVRGNRNQAVSSKSPLWIGRVDYTIRAFDSITGSEKFNLTYSELKPLNTRALSSLSAFSKSNSIAFQTDASNQHSPDKYMSDSNSEKSLVSLSSVPLPLISTPDGNFFFADQYGVRYHSVDLQSPVTQAFTLYQAGSSEKVDSDFSIRSPYDIRPLKVAYRMNSKVLEGNRIGQPYAAIVRNLNDGSLFAVEMSEVSMIDDTTSYSSESVIPNYTTNADDANISGGTESLDTTDCINPYYSYLFYLMVHESNLSLAPSNHVKIPAGIQIAQKEDDSSSFDVTYLQHIAENIFEPINSDAQIAGSSEISVPSLKTDGYLYRVVSTEKMANKFMFVLFILMAILTFVIGNKLDSFRKYLDKAETTDKAEASTSTLHNSLTPVSKELDQNEVVTYDSAGIACTKIGSLCIYENILG